MEIKNIFKPTLLLDTSICERNIKKMLSKTKDSNICFRPHFKTHQSGGIGATFINQGVDKICVSSVDMAEYFIEAGWKNITIAIPVNLREIDRINKLAQLAILNLLIEDTTVAIELNKSIHKVSNVFIKIDNGYNRTGISYYNLEKIDSLISVIDSCENLIFSGFLSHFGNTYSAVNHIDIETIYYDSVSQMNVLKERYIAKYPSLKISIGDTPSASQIDRFQNIDEIRPGNFVFYDVMQYYLGSCKLSDIAICLASPIIAKHEERSEIVVHGGAVHLSKESIQNKSGQTIYGLVAKLTSHGWDILEESNYVSSLSQEHGIVKVDPTIFSSIRIGDVIGIIPVHSCLTANLFREYLSNNGKIVEKM